MASNRKVAQKRKDSPLQSLEFSQVDSDCVTDQLKISLQQENSRLVKRIHDMQLQQVDLKCVIEQQAKKILEYKSFCSTDSLAQEAVELKKQNLDLKNDLEQARRRLVEYENNDSQEEIKQLKRILRSANYDDQNLQPNRESTVVDEQKKRSQVRKFDELETERASVTLGKRKASTQIESTSSFSSSDSSSSYASSSSLDGVTASVPPVASPLLSSSTAINAAASSAVLSVPSSSSSLSLSAIASPLTSSVSENTAYLTDKKVSEEDNETARSKKRGRETDLSDTVDWPSQSAGLSDFESDSDISLPLSLAVTKSASASKNVLEQISVIGAQVSNLESLLQQQQLRADTERRKNLNLKREHEHLRKKNAALSAELETKVSEVRANIQTKEREVNRLQREFDQLRSEVEKERVVREATTKSDNKELETARAKIEDLSIQIEGLQTAKLDLATEVTRLGQMISVMNTTLTGLGERNTQLTADIERVQKEKLDIEAQAEDALAQSKRLEQELAAQKKVTCEHQKLAEHSQHIEEELIRTKEILSGTQSELSLIRSQHEDTAKQLETLVAQRAEMQAVLADDKHELTSLREQVSDLASKASALVETKTHELQRQAQLFQDSQQHSVLSPPPYSDTFLVSKPHESSADECTRGPLADSDDVKALLVASSPSDKNRRSTRRRLVSPGGEVEAPKQVRVLFTGWKDHADYPYSTALRNQLAQIVVELGGVVPSDQEKLDKKFTHMCVPPDCRTAKSLGAALMGRFVVPPQWVLDSKEKGKFQMEASYGAISQQQLKGKVFYISDSFRARWGSREAKMVHVALKLIVTCGSGVDWSKLQNPEQQCDFTLVGDDKEVSSKSGESMPRHFGKLLTWDGFLASVAVSSSDLAANSASLPTSISETRKRAPDSGCVSPVKRRHLPSSDSVHLSKSD